MFCFCILVLDKKGKKQLLVGIILYKYFFALSLASLIQHTIQLYSYSIKCDSLVYIDTIYTCKIVLCVLYSIRYVFISVSLVHQHLEHQHYKVNMNKVNAIYFMDFCNYYCVECGWEKLSSIEDSKRNEDWLKSK